jgi:hypothetical protein
MRIPTRVPRPIDPKPSNFRKIYILLNLYVGPDRRSRSAKRPAGRPVDTGPRSTPRPGSILSEKCDPMAIEVRWPMILLTREPEHCWSRRTAVPGTITQSLPPGTDHSPVWSLWHPLFIFSRFLWYDLPVWIITLYLILSGKYIFPYYFSVPRQEALAAGVASGGNRARRRARNQGSHGRYS